MARQSPHTVIGSEDKIMSVRDGTVWERIPGLSEWNFSGGERDGRSTASDSGLPTGLAGSISAPQFESNVYAVLGHRAWEVILEGFKDNAERRYQAITAEQTLLALTTGSNRAAIAANGNVTFSGEQPTKDDLRIGAVLRIGTDDYMISRVDPSTLAAVVNPVPAAAVTAAVYSLRIPSWSIEFAAKALAVPDRSGSFSQGGELQGPFRLQLRGELPDWSIRPPA